MPVYMRTIGVEDRDPVRAWVSANLQLVAFLGAYFVTTVAGNLIFATPFARQSLTASSSSDRFLSFPHTFTFGYWLLLLCPFVITPVIVLVTKRLTERRVAVLATALPDFTRRTYVIVTLACFAFVIYRFWRADVASLFVSGNDAVSSVEARFTIRERIGFVTLTPLQALLPFLSIYALVRWQQSAERFWMAFTIANVLVLSVLLVMINMKWPVLLFYIAIVLTVFVYSRSHPYLKTAIGAVLVFFAFLLISTFVFRIASVTSSSAEATSVIGHAPRASSRTPAPADAPLAEASERLLASTRVAPAYAPRLLMLALNRMAIAYPYYYQVFTEEGAVCGGILTQARRQPYCRPSEVIYTRIFGKDGFEDRGTSPMAVHISGYALGGWPIALFALTAGSVILGLFAAVPLDRGPLLGALVILGGVSGYHLSQIPGEGVVFYEHGLFWVFLLLVAHTLWRRIAPTVRLEGVAPRDRPITAITSERGSGSSSGGRRA
jgi:hypothetical protein